MMKKQTQNLESLSIWCEYPSDAQKQEGVVDLHLNYWKIPRPWRKRLVRHFTRCLDLGVRLHDPGEASSICLYFPFEVKKDNISDLGAILGKSKNVCCAVFNENCEITHQGNSNHVRVKAGDKNLDLYTLENDRFELESKYGGTVLRVMLPQERKKDLYIRVRIKTPKLKSICTVNAPANSFLQSAFSKDELVDFRINEYRVLNNSLIEDIEKHGRITLQTVHFFFVCSHNEDHVFASTPFKNCRFLESGTWEDYVSPHMPQLKGVSPLAYHWKSPKEKESLDYSVLVKTRYRSSTWFRVFMYLVVFIIISAISGTVSKAIDDKLFSKGDVDSTVGVEGDAPKAAKRPVLSNGQNSTMGQSQ